MSNKYCIDKILEKPAKTAGERQCNVEEVSYSPIDTRVHEESRCGVRSIRSSYVLHVPRDIRKPPLYRPYESFYHPPETVCCCHQCLQQSVPQWLNEGSTSRYMSPEKEFAYRAYIRHPYLIKDERDHTELGNGSLVTRVKQQQSTGATGGSRKKKRHRTAFTPTQLLGLENAFEQSHYSVGEERKQLASFLGLSETQIKVWFQNRRTKWKRIRKEAEEMNSSDEESDVEANYANPRFPHYEPHFHLPAVHEKINGCEKRWSMHNAWRDRERFSM